MDIRGLGASAVDKLVEALGVKDPADIYSLAREDVMKLDNFKDKSADNLVSSIAASKKRELWRLIFGLGILEIGEQFAKDLARKYGSLDALMRAPLEDLESARGLGSSSKKREGKRARCARFRYARFSTTPTTGLSSSVCGRRGLISARKGRRRKRGNRKVCLWRVKFSRSRARSKHGQV